MLKLGFDYQAADYDITQAYTRRHLLLLERRRRRYVYDFRRYGRITDVDTITNDFVGEQRKVKSTIPVASSRTAGASWTRSP